MRYTNTRRLLLLLLLLLPLSRYSYYIQKRHFTLKLSRQRLGFLLQLFARFLGALQPLMLVVVAIEAIEKSADNSNHYEHLYCW